jgi:uncharacterized protein (DUF2237 family)
MNQQFNVLDLPLETCSVSPKTGFYRDGSCHTGDNDHGSHTVCAIVTDEFLNFSKSKGNDLSTPVPQFDFPGLKAGDKWCVCALRWKEAYEGGSAPRVSLMATHKNVLKYIEMDILLQYAVDLPQNA